MRIIPARYRNMAIVIMGLSAFFSADISAELKKVIVKEYSVASGGLLTIEADRGSIEVVSSDEEKVIVEISLNSRTSDKERAEEIFERFGVRFEQNGGDVSVTTDYDGDEDSGWRFWENPHSNKLQVDFFVTVPRNFNISLETRGGSISVKEIAGAIDVYTSGGWLGFSNIEGPINGETSGGSITMENCNGRIDIETSGGSITLGYIKGDILAHTSGGSIEVREVKGALDASTSGGSVTAHIAEQPTDDCRLTTSGGGVTVYLADGLNMNLDARTSSGRVYTDIPITVRGKISKSSIMAKIGNGGPELFLRTSGGNINISEY